MNKQIVVVGGGTAGWLSALFLQKNIPYVNDITVIDNSQIGILGAGEGSVPYLIEFLSKIDIDVLEIANSAGATIKNSIKFTNWRGDGNFYYHHFNDSLFPNFVSNYTTAHNLYVLEQLADKKDFSELLLSTQLCNRNKVKFKRNLNTSNNEFMVYGKYSLHFNALQLAAYLKKIGIQRGIKVLDVKVIDAEQDDNGNISTLITESKDEISCDFVVDCTGFQRLFIGKKYNSKWKSYKNSLPVNRAIPYFLELPETDPIPPFTESIAMSSGWMWRIPVQNRFGCGYVFDSNLLSDDQALDEIEKYYNNKYEIKSPKTFLFEAGCFEQVWIKNCLAVGLSSGFVEPLEATSIWVLMVTLQSFVDNLDGLIYNLESSRKHVNDKISKMNDEILDFIYLHYCTPRTDTKFWNDFNKTFQIPAKTKEFLEIAKNGFPSSANFNYGNWFEMNSYLQVSLGLGLLNHSRAIELFMMYSKDLSDYFEMHKNNYINSLNIQDFLGHREFLNILQN